MKQLTEKQITILTRKIPDWAVKAHPTKKFLSTIDPMAIIERLNVVFGLGRWNFKVEKIDRIEKEESSNKGDQVAIKGILKIPEYGIHIEQFGGNDNKDLGDAYKGSATDALTKIGSYIGIGQEIYKGKGNKDIPDVVLEALTENKG